MRGSTEFKVGIFALIVLAVMTFMTFKVGGLDWAKKKGSSVYIFFSNTAGLDKKTRVKIAGVDAGVVESVELVDGRARVRLFLDPEVTLYSDAHASIRSAGLLGDKYLDIRAGTPGAGVMKDGDAITSVSEMVDMDDLARNLIEVSQNFTKLAGSLNEVLGTDEAKKSLSDTIVNLREVSVSLNRTVRVNDEKLRTVLDNINILTASINSLVDNNRDPLTASISNIRDFSASLRSSGPELIENLNKASGDLRAMVEENRPGLRSAVGSIDSIARQVEKGEGTLGKLVRDDSLYTSLNKAAEGVNKSLSAIDRFRTFITFQAEYLTGEGEGKAYFDVTLQPSPDKYYILGVSGGPVRTVETTTTTTQGNTITEEEISRKIRFNAQFAKRFGDAALRIGLFENTFGAGGDYFFNNDKGRIFAEVWDIQKDEEKAKNAHVKVGVNYFLFKNLFVSGGGDNLMNSKRRGGYVGLGMRFEDDDFKYLLGTVPKISTR
jgi:phospholipid/cholesterol/gamma-HCH transport system substrate-binding protein